MTPARWVPLASAVALLLVAGAARAEAVCVEVVEGLLSCDDAPAAVEVVRGIERRDDASGALRLVDDDARRTRVETDDPPCVEVVEGTLRCE